MAVKVSGSDGVNQSQVTGATQLPVGTTAQRPASPQAGMMRFNTDEGVVEGWNPVLERWQSVSEPFIIQATGGTVTDIEQDGIIYRVHTFTSDGTFEVTRGGEVEYLVVGGGGSGGNTFGYSTASGGGGGAGGVVQGNISVQPDAFLITVGAGAAINTGPFPGQSGERNIGNQGGNSSAFDLTAIGGGAGGFSYADMTSAERDTVLNGGSGGGGGEHSSSQGRVTGANGGGGQALQPTSADGGFGNRGGGIIGEAGAGGGGGAGAPGEEPPNSNTGGNGGIGVSSSITGISTFYAGGGGAGQTASGTRLGGSGGGGNGQTGNSTSTAGAPNTGGGGGGGNSTTGRPSAGGSGIVIVRYRIG